MQSEFPEPSVTVGGTSEPYVMYEWPKRVGWLERLDMTIARIYRVAKLGILICLALCSCALLLQVRLFLKEVPVQIETTRSELVREIQATRTDLMFEVDKQASGLRKDATGQIAALRTDGLARLDTALLIADRRVGDLSGQVATITGKLDSQLTRTNDSLALVSAGVAAATASVPPLLEKSKLLVQDAQDSLDDIYPDLRGFVESSTVAATGVARTSEVVAQAAPAMAKSVTGIAADIHTATAAAVAPTPWYKKVGNVGYAVLILLSRWL